VARLRPQKDGHYEAQGLGTAQKVAEVEGCMRGESATMKNEESELVGAMVIREDEGKSSGGVCIEETASIVVRLRKHVDPIFVDRNRQLDPIWLFREIPIQHICFGTAVGVKDSPEVRFSLVFATISVSHLLVAYHEVYIGVPTASPTSECRATMLDAGIEKLGQGLDVISLAFSGRPFETHKRRFQFGCRDFERVFRP
jgi:hypothetical protein